MLDVLWAAARATFDSLGHTIGAAFVGGFVGLVELYKTRKRGEPLMPGAWKSVAKPSLVAIGFVFAFHLGAASVRVEYQNDPPLRYSLGGSTDLASMLSPVPLDRWVPIKEFRDVALDWSQEREATVNGMASFSVLGPKPPRCRLRLITTHDKATVAVTDWIERPEPPPSFEERVDVPFTMAVPRGDGRLIYRLEITSEQPNGQMAASGELVFARVRP